MALSTLTVSSDFGWCIVTSALMGFQCVLTGFTVGSYRRKFFNKNFFKTNFPELKEEEYPEGGYPDMGSGRYAAKLSHGDWVTFNNAQRAHYNYIEGLVPAVSLELLAGLFYPRLATVLGVTYMIGRTLYARGYVSNGSRGRRLGVAVLDLALIGLLGATLWGGYSFAGGFNSLLKWF
eukprot:TRINITY_DN1869_c0_g1_i1.p1 TRINITY_DN1869_c0_g1~~TRINITY_DN1869_c0_g1_i1.p1  ORF type:complete len:178 (-),score=15.30 TRINITY_DN1869_c0_g1_i1:607-1140(-)